MLKSLSVIFHGRVWKGEFRPNFKCAAHIHQVVVQQMLNTGEAPKRIGFSSNVALEKSDFGLYCFFVVKCNLCCS